MTTLARSRSFRGPTTPCRDAAAAYPRAQPEQRLEAAAERVAALGAAALTDDATWWVSGSLPISGLYEGNRVAVEWQGFATSATGNDYRQLYHTACELTDGGKIAPVREYNDTLYSLGALFT